MSEPTIPSTVRLTRAQVREIDRRSIEDYHIPGIVLMENAAWAVTRSAIEMLAAQYSREVLILCGGGNNGGDGLAVSRHLHNAGFRVTVATLTDPTRYKRDALINWNIVRAMSIAVVPASGNLVREARAAIFVDAMYGTGLTGAPRDPFREVSEALFCVGRPVVSVDVPSGLDCDTGEPLGMPIRATRTVTFVAEKTGFANPASREYTGEIIVGDIGCPRELIDAVRSLGDV